MKLEKLEIEIRPDGDVRVQVKGRKGPACMDYKELFREILGEVKSVETTDEYYEQELVECVNVSSSTNRKR